MIFRISKKLRRPTEQRDALADVANVLSYQRVLETSTNGYLVRQYLYSSLYDRMRYVQSSGTRHELTVTARGPS